MVNNLSSQRSYTLSKAQVPPTVVEQISTVERAALIDKIKTELQRQNAIIIAHYYTAAELQILADETGGYVSDSLDMARFGNASEAKTLIVCGVKFMGETAKILNPEKRVLMPDLEANCSLDLGCPEDAFTAFCDDHPEHTVVVYANTSAKVKARADWMVTSGSAVDVVKYLSAEGKKIIWAPDKYLGNYVQKETGANMLIWQGACVVHEEFKAKELGILSQSHPEAKILVHPESPSSVIELADFVGSTTAIINAVKEMAAKTFIIATDAGIFHKIKEVAPDKVLIEAPTAGKSATCISCAHCPWMAMNNLSKIAHILDTGENEVFVDTEVAQGAKISIQRLLDFSKTQVDVKTAGDA